MGFHVPRVTINIDFKEGSSFGELSLISVGYGLHQAWIYSSMFDKGGIFGSAMVQAGPTNEVISLAYFISILVYGALLLLASAMDTKLIRLLHSLPVLAGAALLGTVGTLLLLAPALTGQDAVLLSCLSGVLTGAGSCVLLLAWGIAFSRQDSASIVINGALTIAIGFGVYGLVLHSLPFPLGGIASALIPVCEVLLLMLLQRRISLDFEERQLMFNPLPINHARFVLRFGLPVFLLGLALGILRQTSIETVLPGIGFADQSIIFLTSCGATILIMVTFLALGGNERWHTFFRPLIPFIAITAFFIPFSRSNTGGFGTYILLTGYMSFEALMWIFFAELSQRFRLSPIFIFGLGRGVMALAALGGSMLPLFANSPLMSTFGEAGIVIVVILAMMLAFAFLPDEKEIASITDLDPAMAAAVERLGRKPYQVVGVEDSDSSECVTLSSEAPVSEEDGRETVPTPGPAPASDAEPTSAVTLEVESAQASAKTESPVSAAPEASTPATVAVPSEARLAMMGQQTVTDDQVSDGSPGYFRRRCDVIANTYLLSRRESEVLSYLARGYNSAYIQEQLYISEGTAKTHIRHIYRKLNIHSQQDLMRLVDEIDV